MYSVFCTQVVGREIWLKVAVTAVAAVMVKVQGAPRFVVAGQVGAEKPVGDVFEIAIECKEWEGSLDALVHFLYDLESAGVMLDMRQMFMRPHPTNRGLLRGTFTLHCAYMREKPAAAVASPAGGGARNAKMMKKKSL